jgi:dTMP kinase
MTRAVFLAIEGGDGAGKRTLTNALTAELTQRGKSALNFSFPSYGETAASSVISNILDSRLMRPNDPRVMALLFAADRFEKKSELHEALNQYDFLICDRYVASNAAYLMAQITSSEALEAQNWIAQLEFETLQLPRPHLNIFIDADVALSKKRQSSKDKRQYTDRVFDTFEIDDSLQTKVRLAYRNLLKSREFGKWLTLSPLCGGEVVHATALASTVLDAIEA